jgi:N-acetylmuramoyl-L-alanine amidase
MTSISFSRAAVASVLSTILIAVSLVIVRSVSATPPIDEVPQHVVCFVNAEQTMCVNRPSLSAAATLTDEVRSLIQLLLAGPTQSESTRGAQSALPAAAQLASVEVNDDRVNLKFIFPSAFLTTLTDQQVEDINEQFRITFTPYNFQRIDVNVRRSDGAYQPLSKFLKPIEQPRKPHPLTAASLRGTFSATKQSPTLQEIASQTTLAMTPSGGLSNKTVFVSAGHGWYWSSAFGAYKTQRPVFPSAPYPAGEGIIEDFNNAEGVNQYLLSYLENAGADVWPVRERDMNTAMIVVDNTSPNFSTQGNWTSSSAGYGGTYKSVTAGSTSIATATWTFTPTSTATYAVYVWFPGTASPAVDAHFFVEHAGATTPVTISQTRDANTWRYIGRFPFYGDQAARIYLTNQSNTSGVTVMADAVRIGGGLADTSAPDTSIISGKPRWEEQAWTYAKWLGLTDVYSYNDTIVRPIYSEWEKDPGEDAVYLAWHTNGFNGYNTMARGTETYIHSFQPTPNSDVLQNFIHTELINDIHAGWDPDWPDRGQKSADYGELRLLSTLPGVLIENGFHDSPIDVDALKDPRFLQLSARAIYQGLVRYWHAIDSNVPLIFLPEPPQQVMVRNSGPGQITINWKSGSIDGSGLRGDAATAYRVYTSPDGFGWSNPIDVEHATTVYTLTGLIPNQLIFVKVTGMNAGGESLPSPVLAARTPTFGVVPLLIVDGFDRIDRLGDVQQNDAPEGVSRRVFVDRINRFDAIIQHATAIHRPFDSAQRAAVASGALGLESYFIVDWIAGEEQAPFTALSTSDQTALTSFLNRGGALFLSGSKLGYELRDTAFYSYVLHASYLADTDQTYVVTPTVDGLFYNLDPLTFDDGTHGTYDVDVPNRFNPITPATSTLVYNMASAALQYEAGCTRLVYSAVPFETFYPDTQRQAVMDRVMVFLGACVPLEAPYHTFVPLLTRMQVATPSPVCRDIITNGGFETGDFAPGWYVLAATPLPGIITDTVHNGSYAARIGALTISDTLTQTAYSSFGQTLSIPAEAITVTLSVERYRYSGNSNNAQYAVVLDAKNQVHYLFTNHADDPQWIHDQFDLLAYAGQTIKLWFSVYNSGNGGTAGMLIDDVQTRVCVP